MGTTPLSDAELIARARAGDDSAFSELYERHQGAAHRLAATYPRAGPADDLVNNAFERVLGAIRRGAGPDRAFRAYLFVTLRRLAAAQIAASYAAPIGEVPEGLQAEAHEVIDLAERALVLDAYGSLPDRMQAVLWQTEVEGRRPRELAPVLGMTANATAALASRAREKLRQAYLQAHLAASPHPECEPHRGRLGAYVRGDLGERALAATELHVHGCPACQELVAELTEVNSLFVRALVPWFVAPAHAAGVVLATGTAAAGVGAATAGTPGGGAAAGGALVAARQFGRGVVTKARANPGVTATVAVGSALAVAAMAVALIASDTPTPHIAAPSLPSTSEGSTQVPPSEAPTTVPPTTAPAPRPTAPPATPAPLRVAGPPPAAPTTATAPAVVAGPVVWLPDESRVRVTLTNSGAEATRFLLVTVEPLGGSSVSGSPTGCARGLAVHTPGVCGLPPLDPGETAVVKVPIEVTGAGQRVRVTVCGSEGPRRACETPILGPTTVAVD